MFILASYSCERLEEDAGIYECDEMYFSSGSFIITLVLAGTEAVIQTFPPTMECVPITVSPPNMVAPD